MVVSLPRSLVHVLAVAAESLRSGDAVAVLREDIEVSPAEAARLLGVSRQYVDRLIGTGALPVRRLPGSTYRKIPARAVLAYREASIRKRRRCVEYDGHACRRRVRRSRGGPPGGGRAAGGRRAYPPAPC
ncbi:MAG: excisionase family DNA-binding protein, partial [Acidimicrobiales bacterium]